jgi:hypothetical protein
MSRSAWRPPGEQAGRTDAGAAGLLPPGVPDGLVTASWPEGFEDGLGGSTSMIYVTPDEARELYGELMKTVERTIGREHRFTERRDPARRPPGAVPVEFVLLGYPVLDAPPLPGDSGDSDSEHDSGDSDSGDPGAGPGG